MTLTCQQSISSIVAIICMLVATISLAQPDWSVNPAQFEFTMTVTAVGIIKCVETVDENDMVGAFINNEVRGVQAFNVDDEGRKFAFLIIYDNEVSGNAVEFKLYDASEDMILNEVHTLQFQENGSYGNVVDPFQFSTNFALDTVALRTDSIGRDVTPGTVVSQLLALDTAGNAAPADFMFGSDILGPDNSRFSIAGASLILEDAADLETRDLFTIHIVAGVGDSCTATEGILELRVVDFVSALGKTLLPDPGLRIYPNPATNGFYVAADEVVDAVDLYTLQGRHVRRFVDVRPGERLELGGLQMGAFVCVIRNGKSLSGHRLVVVAHE